MDGVKPATGSKLAPVIKSLRKARGMTQLDLANRSGILRTTIANIEAGRQGVTEEVLGKLAAAFGCVVVVQFKRAEWPKNAGTLESVYE